MSAVQMDGNRKSAKCRGLPVRVGHGAGGLNMKEMALTCKKFGVQVLTAFAFPAGNWVRPEVPCIYVLYYSPHSKIYDISENIFYAILSIVLSFSMKL